LFSGVIPEQTNLFFNHLGDVKVFKFSMVIAINPKQSFSCKEFFDKVSMFSDQIEFFVE